MARSSLVTGVCVLWVVAPAIAQERSGREELEFFESRIRRVLVRNCYECHSAESDDPEAKLFVDTREGIRRGGESGPTVVPGNLRESLLIKALCYSDDSLRHRPVRSFGAREAGYFRAAFQPRSRCWPPNDMICHPAIPSSVTMP